MAIYHLSHGMVSRSTGRSSVQSAAYITGEKLHESRRDLNVNYQNRHSDIAFTTTLAPEQAPEMFHHVKVWDHFENFEDEYAYKRYKTDQTREAYLNSAQTAQTIVVALPRELSIDVCVELITQFAKERFISRGLVVTLAMHDDEGNPHAHLQISRRAVNENGEIAWAKDREICTKKELLVTRKLWADLTNQYLEREGHEARITEKSFADLGIQLEPTQHRGWIADKLEGMGITSRIVQANIEAFEQNRERLIETPETILPELTQNNATFTQLQLLKTVQKRVGDDASLVAHVFENALTESIVVGEGIDGQLRYTSPIYQAIEQQAVTLTSELITAKFSQPQITKTVSEDYLASKFSHLSPEQQQAVIGLAQDNQFSVLVGRAGAGKTTALRAVSELYKNAGHKVIGTSLAAMAADNLGKEAGIEAATIHSLVYGWERFQAAQDKFLSFNSIIDEGVLKQIDWYQDLKRFEGMALTKETVLIVDEAGMVGTRLWNELLVHVKHAGAKLIAVGDDHQFKAIEAGDFFRELKDQAVQANSLYQLGTIYRQKQPWMKDTSMHLANLEVNQALSAYENRGHVFETTRDTLAQEIATAYVRAVSSADQKQKTEECLSLHSENRHSEPRAGAWNLGNNIDSITGSQQNFVPLDDGVDGDNTIAYAKTVSSEPNCLVLAFTNAQAYEINQAIREQLKLQSLLDNKDSIVINDKPFAIGDRIVFLENDKTRLTITNTDGVVQEGVNIKNGTQGVITGVNTQGDIQIALKQIGGEDLLTSIKCLSSSTPKVAIGQPTPEPIRTYNYTNIAHGYAVTTHKAQGQTVDQVLVAASKNMDAKGFYVAMTRHREDVKLFYAKEDFPTFKTLSSHLSRFEHKDLVKDYTIRPEHEAAWQRVQEYRLCVLDGSSARNQAIKNNDPSMWSDYHQIKQDQINLGREILKDFDAHKLYINQAGLTQEMLQITTGQKARSLSNAEEKAKLTVELYGETAQVTRELWREIRQTHPGSLCYQHPKYEQFKEMRVERNQLAHLIQENASLHREFVREFSRVYGINKRTIDAQSKQYLRTTQERDKNKNSAEKEEIWYNTGSYNLCYGKYLNNIYGNTCKYLTKSVDPTLIKQELNSRIKDLAFQFLGQPQSQKPTEWRYGNKGSISIHVAGSKQGLYSNFETGESGNALKFIQDQLQCDHKQAFKWGGEWLGQDRFETITKTPLAKAPSQPQVKQEWTPVYPAPATPVDLKAEPQVAYMLNGRQEIARYAYKDADGHILGYVVRLEDKNGHKITPTLTYCQNDKSEKHWRWQGFGNDRPLYGLDQLKAKPNAMVLIVEGEKTYEAARVLFPDHAVVTWSGGAGAVQKSDWSSLKNRSVIIWPDNDKAGANAAQKISHILKAQGNQVRIVDLPSTLPHKWDLADKVPDGLDVGEILQSSSKEKISASIYPKVGYRIDQETFEKNQSIINYFKVELNLERNDWVDAKDIAHLIKLAEQDPMTALRKWQNINQDYSFEPMTHSETQLKEAQAHEILEKAKTQLFPALYDQMQKNLPSHAEGIIQKCQETLASHAQREREYDLAIFKKICERYNDASSASQKLSYEKSLREVVARHENDPKFMQAIESSTDKNIQKAAELFKNEPLKQHKPEVSRGFER